MERANRRCELVLVPLIEASMQRSLKRFRKIRTLRGMRIGTEQIVVLPNWGKESTTKPRKDL